MARRTTTPLADLPDVCFVEHVCGALGISLTKLKRLLSTGTFPIRQIDSLDRQRRWSKQAICEFVNGGGDVRRRWQRVG